MENSQDSTKCENCVRLEAENETLRKLLKRANRFNVLSKVESAPAWNPDSPFQKEIDALLTGED